MADLPELPHMDAALREGLAALMAEGRGIAAAEERFGPLAARLRECVEERERLIDGAGEDRAVYSVLPALEAWREDSRRPPDLARRRHHAPRLHSERR